MCHRLLAARALPDARLLGAAWPVFQAAAVVALAVVLGTPALPWPATAPAAKPPAASTNDMGWQ
ncbi:hypothetical protein [Streptomyces subrutilus]|uniref:Uncharacterized protein n=1 Tax=Streptomyces subrutilus TaxID=36818 RepID=A0A1E5PU98_9ACTN|nr:hypothetical protein [Streptomyces subrutilus]OEJ33119.1 hypothetical protein BGK67_18935 [Streptomyces subrutilus]